MLMANLVCLSDVKKGSAGPGGGPSERLLFPEAQHRVGLPSTITITCAGKRGNVTM